MLVKISLRMRTKLDNFPVLQFVLLKKILVCLSKSDLVILKIPFHSLKEAWYYMQAPKKITHKDVVSESTKLHATTSVDPELQKALCNEEDGFMQPGAMPAVTAASAAGSKMLLEAVAKARPCMGMYIDIYTHTHIHKNA